MSTIETFFIIFYGIQVLHSIEELSNNFHKRCPFGSIKFKYFLTFEILFLAVWLLIFITKTIDYREQLLAFFNLLMFGNGIWHLTWFAFEKKYVPGIFTAPGFIVTFLVYYFKFLF